MIDVELLWGFDCPFGVVVCRSRCTCCSLEMEKLGELWSFLPDILLIIQWDLIGSP